ncbi:hypothetical protein [Streptomyces millisiae]|uniref:DUF4232 domain-containing protein n=1 Tax=Streptomyces millisiae TaxID=3075542 RepID=A0ABU2LW65_9ACTN|nr:hypothetical protein [Streptomyces sp. DSM 44918]MDT0321513.1 hypothetical protein [Streptomyces sp. DSM 44918]
MPSAIYWRRRAVLLLLLALVALLVFWALRGGGGGGGGGSDNAGDDGNGGPAETITPGSPQPSESLIDERPGGREESTADEEDGSAGAGGGAGDGEADGAGEDAGAGAGGGGQQTDAGGSGGGAALDPAGLPACGPGDVTLSLRSEANAYGPEDEPELRLTAQNGSGAACALDFGLDRLTVTLSDAEDDLVWSSAHCPEGARSVPTAVPAGGTASHAISWDQRHSDADACGSPGRAADPGTYLAEATLDGYEVVQTSFLLEED